MKILVISDTHGILINAYSVLEKIHNKIEMVFHLGDNIEDAQRLALQYKNLSFHYVAGNCDIFGGGINETEKVVKAKGVNFFLTHGHKQNVKWGLERMSYATSEVAEIGLFGHTHTPCIDFIGSSTVINPGSISFPREVSYPTYAVIELCDDKKINASIIAIKNKDSSEIIEARMFYAKDNM